MSERTIYLHPRDGRELKGSYCGGIRDSYCNTNVELDKL